MRLHLYVPDDAGRLVPVLEALAFGLARVLVDLAAWGTDEPDPGAQRPEVEDDPVTEYPTSFSSQARAAREHLRTHPRLVRLTPGQRDRIVREVRAEREARAAGGPVRAA